MRSDVDLMRLSDDELTAMLLRDVRFRNKRCVDALLRRVQSEVMARPHKAIPLAQLGPDLVELSSASLKNRKQTYLLRAYGVLGDLLGAIGAQEESKRSLRTADTYREGSDQHEVVGLDLRWAIFRLRQLRFAEALRLADAAADYLRHNRGQYVERDDLALADALVVRGMIYTYGYCHGENYSASAAAGDFQKALQVSSNRTPHCRLAAAKNLGVTAVWTWMTIDPKPLDPLNVFNQLEWVRQEARRQRIPRRSVFDARARWIQAMAMAEMSKGLSENATRLFTSALKDLQEYGAPQDVATLLLDYQWWLLHDNFWGRALNCQRQLEALAGHLPTSWRGLVAQWGEALRQSSVSSDLVGRIFLEMRGIRGVISPVGKPVRWTGGW